MPNSTEKNRERRKLRYWVYDPEHRNGGWWEAPVGNEAHGKFGTYSNWGCMCPRCEEANEEHSRRNRRRSSEILRKTFDFIVHRNN